MRNTTKKVARMTAALLAAHGVKDAILSPGTRNAPLIVAIERHPAINARVVIDERSAAFIALGISNSMGNSPVALVCTSGTAPLNYAPAVAEAFYREIPLIVITADRPSEWIDQDDSQTIKQIGIYHNYIKGSFDIPLESDDPDRMWMINRSLNDAMLLATDGRRGPVHINIRLCKPLNGISEFDDNECANDSDFRFISRITNCNSSGFPYEYEALCATLAPESKILILAGFMIPSGLDEVVAELAARPNVVVMHEAQSNLHGNGNFVANIDATLCCTNPDKRQIMAPDLLITIGGSLTSGRIKAWLRTIPNLKHWYIGQSDHPVDCFRKLAVIINDTPINALTGILQNLAIHRNKHDTEYKQLWNDSARASVKYSSCWGEKCSWCDFKAVDMIIKALPKGSNLQISNGTAVRYVQLFDYSKFARIDCNRGVSGIDGCTSTAIGASLTSTNSTILITGDMSMQYDIGALGCTFIPDNFKIIVLNNGGGSIFRIIPSTRNLDELHHNFVADLRLPLKTLSAAYGFRYFSATNESELNENLQNFIIQNDIPAILEIRTDGDVSAKYLRKYFESLKNI